MTLHPLLNRTRRTPRRAILACAALALCAIAARAETAIGHHPNGRIAYQHTYTPDGVRNGPSIDYHDNGRVARFSHYRNGQQHMRTTTHGRDGGLLSAEAYQFGKRHGYSRTYYPDGSVKSERRFRNGSANGMHKTFHPDGRLRSQVEEINGKHRGPYRLYNPEGRMIKRGDYDRDGQRSGLWRTFGDDGSLVLEHQYVHDELHGPVRSFHPDGRLAYESRFAQGELHGPFTEYHPNGQPKETGEHHFGKRRGTWKTFSEDGTLIEEAVYEGGRLIRQGPPVDPKDARHVRPLAGKKHHALHGHWEGSDGRTYEFRTTAQGTVTLRIDPAPRETTVVPKFSPLRIETTGAELDTTLIYSGRPLEGPFRLSAPLDKLGKFHSKVDRSALLKLLSAKPDFSSHVDVTDVGSDTVSLVLYRTRVTWSGKGPSLTILEATERTSPTTVSLQRSK